MRSLKVSTASQAKQRRIANEWSGEDFTVEDAPFLFEDKAKKGNFDIVKAPWGHVDNLGHFILNLLDDLEA